MAIHIYRNLILIGIFVGGYSFTIAYSFLNQFTALSINSLQGVRAVILAALLFASFLSMASAIRAAVHAGFLLGSGRMDEDDELIHESYTERLGSLTSNLGFHVSFGFRVLIVAVPFGLLGAGLTALVISSALILCYLFKIDFYSRCCKGTDADGEEAEAGFWQRSSTFSRRKRDVEDADVVVNSPMKDCTPKQSKQLGRKHPNFEI